MAAAILRKLNSYIFSLDLCIAAITFTEHFISILLIPMPERIVLVSPNL